MHSAMKRIEFSQVWNTFSIDNRSYQIDDCGDMYSGLNQLWQYQNRTYCSFYKKFGGLIWPMIEIYSLYDNGENSSPLSRNDWPFYDKLIKGIEHDRNICTDKICWTTNHEKQFVDWELDNGLLVSHKRYFGGKTEWVANQEIVMRGGFIRHPLEILRHPIEFLCGSSYVDVMCEDDIPHFIGICLTSSPLIGSS